MWRTVLSAPTRRLVLKIAYTLLLRRLLYIAEYRYIGRSLGVGDACKIFPRIQCTRHAHDPHCYIPAYFYTHVSEERRDKALHS